MVEKVEHKQAYQPCIPANPPTLEDCDRQIHMRYIPSAKNPADSSSQGLYPSCSLLLDPIIIPDEVQPFLIDV